MTSSNFWFSQNILDDQGFEAGHVPDIDEGHTEEAGGEEDIRQMNKDLEALTMKPGDDENSEEEGGDIDDGIDSVLQGELVRVTDKMEDPGLVEHSVDLWHEADDGEPMSEVEGQSSSTAGHCPHMVNCQEAVLAVEDHLQGLGYVDSEGEEETVDGSRRGSVEKISSEAGRIIESPNCPDTSDASIDTSQVARPPLVHPLVTGLDLDWH